MVATIAVFKKTIAEMKKASVKLFQGEITVSKKDCWLVGTILVLSGIAVGLINAPWTHGVHITIGSHNGCHNGNNSANNGHHNGSDCLPEEAKEQETEQAEQLSKETQKAICMKKKRREKKCCKKQKAFRLQKRK